MDKLKNDTLVIFTNQYPFSGVSESFLDSELPVLNEYFDKIILVPQRLPSSIEKVEKNLPSHVIVDTSFLEEKNKKWNKLLAHIDSITSINLYFELLRRIHKPPNIAYLKKTIGYFSLAIQTKKWILSFIKKGYVDLTKTVFYTYWLNETTLGIGLAKKNLANIKLVSRAHRGDLYENQTSSHHIPFRPAIFRYINKLFIISEHGLKYLSNHYPQYSSIYCVSRLGVFDSKHISSQSRDSIFRILSCSYIVPVKRLELIVYGLKELGNSKPEKEFEWVHIGHGPLFIDIEGIAKATLPKNVKFQLLGYLPREDLVQYYEKKPIDVFINVSESEGIPVSIMEAQSYGVPVIATAVGGTPEIVSSEIGILLDKNPSPKDISDAICAFIDDPEIIPNKKKQSKQNWSNNYSAEKNFTDFAYKLKKV